MENTEDLKAENNKFPHSPIKKESLLGIPWWFSS